MYILIKGIILSLYYLIQSPVDVAEKVNTLANQLTIIGLLAIICVVLGWFLSKQLKAKEKAFDLALEEQKKIVAEKNQIIKDKDEYLERLIQLIREDNEKNNKVTTGLGDILKGQNDSLEDRLYNKFILALNQSKN